MGIQSFTPTSGGSPDKQFIATCALDTASRDWTVNGSAGYYIMQSATFKSGYVIFSDGTNKTGTPIGLAVNVNHNFNTIFLMGIAGDQFTLYKVSPKTTTSVADPFSRFTIGHTSITSSTTHNFPALNLPVADLLVIGGGGGAGHHGGGGGGAGAYIYLTKYPMSAVNPCTVPGRAAAESKGGYTALGGIIANGGGFGGGHNARATGGAGANGGGGGGGHQSPGEAVGGSADTIPSLPFGFTYAGAYYGIYAGGHAGGSVSGSANNYNLRGGGGGGANGAGSTGHDQNGGNGGAGIASPFNAGTHAGQHFCAGGAGSNHSPGQHGSNGSGWTDGGYGCGGQSHPNNGGLSSRLGGAGLIAYRGYS